MKETIPKAEIYIESCTGYDELAKKLVSSGNTYVMGEISTIEKLYLPIVKFMPYDQLFENMLKTPNLKKLSLFIRDYPELVSLNNYFTAKVNQYIAMLTNTTVYIDSFAEDYVSLLGFKIGHMSLDETTRTVYNQLEVLVHAEFIASNKEWFENNLNEIISLQELESTHNVLCLPIINTSIVVVGYDITPNAEVLSALSNNKVNTYMYHQVGSITTKTLQITYNT